MSEPAHTEGVVSISPTPFDHDSSPQKDTGRRRSLFQDEAKRRQSLADLTAGTGESVVVTLPLSVQADFEQDPQSSHWRS